MKKHQYKFESKHFDDLCQTNVWFIEFLWKYEDPVITFDQGDDHWVSKIYHWDFYRNQHPWLVKHADDFLDFAKEKLKQYEKMKSFI